MENIAILVSQEKCFSFISFFFNWRITVLQCCISNSFCCTINESAENWWLSDKESILPM